MTPGLAEIRLDELLQVGRARSVSDIHIRAGMAPMLRIDGELVAHGSMPATDDEVSAITRSVLTEDALTHLHAKGDATSTYRTQASGNVRVHAYLSRGQTTLALRLLATSIPALDTLDLPVVVHELTAQRHGLVLFTGPTGSGKTTALAAFADSVNRHHAKHIVTLEDPIEYDHCPIRSVVSQRQVGNDVATFAEAIYAALRSDPDVLIIGEMRDASAMQAALMAAETGHLVCATLHTGDASRTVDRILAAFSGEMQHQIRIQLSQTLLAVICLRLVPRAHGPGRRSASEVLLASDAVRNLIRDGKTHQLQNIVATSRLAGMRTLEAHLSELAAAGEIASLTTRARM